MDGSRSTAPADPWSKSQGTTPATVPGTRIEKMSVFKATMNALLCHANHVLPCPYSSKETRIIQNQPIRIHRKFSSKPANPIRKTLIKIPPSKRGNLQTGIALLSGFNVHLRNRDIRHAEYYRGTWLEC